MTGPHSLDMSFFLFLCYPLSTFHWTNFEYHWIVSSWTFRCIAAVVDDTKHHLTSVFWSCMLPLQILVNSVLLPAYSASCRRPCSCTRYSWPSCYEIRVWFSFLVSVLSAPVSQSRDNTRIPVLNFLNSLDRCHRNLHCCQKVRNQFYLWFLVASLESAKTDYLRSFATVPRSLRASFLFCSVAPREFRIIPFLENYA